MPEVIFKDLGLIDYKEAWDYQETLFREIIDQKIRLRNGESMAPTKNYLLFCEHPHVYTLGKSGDKENLLLDDAGLNAHDAKFYEINRGETSPIMVRDNWWYIPFSISIIFSPIYTNTCAIWRKR